MPCARLHNQRFLRGEKVTGIPTLDPFEMSQQRSKSLLIGCIIAPMCEVADVTGGLEGCSPVLLTVQEGIIKANGKENHAQFAVFSRQGEFYFVTNPSAVDGVL